MLLKDITYLCPIKRGSVDFETIDVFRRYWEFLSSYGCEVLVVDGSPPEVFAAHHLKWVNCTHVKVDNSYGHLNGKVNGIWTGLPLASNAKIILADDDIIYGKKELERMSRDLDKFEVVRPQNYFYPQKPWTKIDSARILWNRSAFPEGDFPGTLGFRKHVLLKAGPYDGDVLFDNEELVKHFQNNQARVLYATDFFIERRPPCLQKWLEQRPRQAYEDFLMPVRSGFFFSIFPMLLGLFLMNKKRWIIAAALLLALFSILKTSRGRRNGASKFFPLSTVLYAPLWVLERSVSIYLALFWKIRRGGYPFGEIVISKGTGKEFQLYRKRKRKNQLGKTSENEYRI